MKNIFEYLKERYGPWGWMGQRAHDAAGVNSVMPLDFIISCDYGAEIPLFFREKDVFSVEALSGIRKDWSNEDLRSSFTGRMGSLVRERWNAYRRKVSVLCYRSLRKLESGSSGLSKSPRVLAVPEKLKRHFDNKILLYRNLEKLSIPRIPGFVDSPGNRAFKDLRGELSLPFVIQFPYGSSGNFTFLIREEKDYSRVRELYPGMKAVMRRYIDGFSLNCNAVIVSGGESPRTVCSMPSVQITGLAECSNFPSAFCGNDYAASRDLEPGILEQVRSQMKAAGAWMAGASFRGVFGMDFVVRGGRVYPVEINPRFQNSTSLFTMLKAMSDDPENTLFLLHAAEFLGVKDRLMRKFINDFPVDQLMRPLKGSQVILHNRMARNVVSGRLDPGVYRLEGSGLKFLRPGATLASCRNCKDILVTCGVPQQGMPIEPNAPVCKIQMRESALDASSKRKLTRTAKKAVEAVYLKLALKEAVPEEAAVAGSGR